MAHAGGKAAGRWRALPGVWSRAIMHTGVMSFQLKFAAAASGVVNRLDSVTTR